MNEPQKLTELGLVPNSWEVVMLGDLRLDIGDGNYSTKYPRQDQFVSQGVPFLRAVNLKGGRVVWEDMRFISEELHSDLLKGHIKEDDVILVTRGNIGQAAFVSEEFIGANMNAQLVRINGNASIFSRFLYFTFLHEERQKQFLSLTTGTALKQLPIGKLKTVLVPLPPLPEQKKIAHILSTVHRAIETQERIIQTTTELKKALMHKFFTEGLRNEAQKQTEIGLVPESWEVVELGTLFQKAPQNGIYKHKKEYGTGTQILRIDDFGNDGNVVTKAKNLVSLSSNEIESYGLETGDIVINRVNSLSHLGKTALIGEIGGEMVFESNMMRFSVNEAQVRKQYVFKFLNSSLTKKQIIGTAKRAVAQSSINQGDVKSILVPKPSLVEQEEIVGGLEAIESKISIADRKMATLKELFHTLLDELMTAKTRIHCLEIPEIGASV